MKQKDKKSQSLPFERPLNYICNSDKHGYGSLKLGELGLDMYVGVISKSVLGSSTRAFHSGEAYRVRRASYREQNPGHTGSYCVGGRSARKGLVKTIQNS